MSHTCQSLVIRCIDFRIRPSVFAVLMRDAGHHEGTYDLLSCAGSGKHLASWVPFQNGFLLGQIALSKNLHGICEVIIVYHDNCGAYGIHDPHLEEKKQQGDFLLAQKRIRKLHPELGLLGYIIKGTPTGAIRLERITV